jgi:mono/diheme cytochrome c family protein
VDTNEIILGLVALVLVVFSLTVALVVPRRRPDFPGRHMAAFLAVSAVLVAGVLGAVEALGESHDFSEHAEAAEPAAAGAAEEGGGAGTTDAEGGTEPGDPAAGKEVFASAGCAGCHTLADAGATGTVGPNLDDAKPPYELAIDRVTNGSGPMPAFAGQLTEQQIQDVAAYVIQATGGG